MAFMVIGVIVLLMILVVLVAPPGYPRRSPGRPGGCQPLVVLAFLVLLFLAALFAVLSVFVRQGGGF